MFTQTLFNATRNVADLALHSPTPDNQEPFSLPRHPILERGYFNELELLLSWQVDRKRLKQKPATNSAMFIAPLPSASNTSNNAVRSEQNTSRSSKASWTSSSLITAMNLKRTHAHAHTHARSIHASRRTHMHRRPRTHTHTHTHTHTQHRTSSTCKIC